MYRGGGGGGGKGYREARGLLVTNVKKIEIRAIEEVRGREAARGAKAMPMYTGSRYLDSRISWSNESFGSQRVREFEHARKRERAGKRAKRGRKRNGGERVSERINEQRVRRAQEVVSGSLAANDARCRPGI